MGSLKELITNEPFHSRTLEMKTYALDDETILVEGWLKENRYHNVYDITGEAIEKGPVHHMAIRLKVGGTPLTILDAEAEMVHVPLEFCHETLDRVQQIIGLSISSGFQKKIRDLMGGEKGCAHLTHLLTVMSQAVFQGYVAHRREKPHPAPRSLEDVEGLDSVLGTCRAWREDGPKMEKLKGVIARATTP